MSMQLRPSYAYEWPTLCLLALTYTLWTSITLYAQNLGPVLSILFLTPVITMHSSLQHETLHTIEPRWKWFGQFLVFPAVGLLIPYLRFRDSHLIHHINENLTDPYDDPESAYMVKDVWVTLPRWLQSILTFNNTLAGRLLLGPLIGQIAFMRADWRMIKGGDRTVLTGWLVQIPAVALVILWLMTFGTMPFWAYAIATYFGLSILKVRTFLEHRSHVQANGRSVIIEGKGILSFLFLNNNFHAVHHAHPSVAWYNLPALYRANKAKFIDGNRGYTYASYPTIFRKYFFHAKEPVEHPLWNLKNRHDR
ncbi:MAG: fatty acid desaturase [Paracoccaceae bacterium]